MDRLISLEPSNLVAIRIEQGQKCYGELTLRNLMYTMPVAFRLQPMNKIRYTIRPQSGIISPLTTLRIEITYDISTNLILPESSPYCNDSFLLHSVVVPGAVVKNPSSTFDTVPNDWFTIKKKQVFVDSGTKIMFVGSHVLAQLVVNGAAEEIRDVLERSDPSWKAANSADADGQTLLHLAIGLTLCSCFRSLSRTSKLRVDPAQLLLKLQQPRVRLLLWSSCWLIKPAWKDLNPPCGARFISRPGPDIWMS